MQARIQQQRGTPFQSNCLHFRIYFYSSFLESNFSNAFMKTVFFPDWNIRPFNSRRCEDVPRFLLQYRHCATQTSNIFPSHSEWFGIKKIFCFESDDKRKINKRLAPPGLMPQLHWDRGFVKTSISAYLVGSKAPQIKSNLKPSNWSDNWFILNFLFQIFES